MDGVIEREHASLAALVADVANMDGRCAACRSAEGRLRFCRACRYVKYCDNGVCQVEGWNTRGHRQACGALAADRAVAAGASSFDPDPATLPPLGDILAGLNDVNHAGAYLAATRLSLSCWAAMTAPCLRRRETPCGTALYLRAP